MKVPAFQYGRYREALSACRKRVTKLARGATWEEATAGADLDTASSPGLIVLHGPSPLLGGTANFQCFLLHTLVLDAGIDGRITRDALESVFAQSLQSAWSVLALLGQGNGIWAVPENRREPLLRAALRFWSVFEQEGRRFSNGSNDGDTLWGLPNGLKSLLSNLGVPTDVLNSPLPEGGPAQLLLSSNRHE